MSSSDPVPCVVGDAAFAGMVHQASLCGATSSIGNDEVLAAYAAIPGYEVSLNGG